MEVVDPPKSAPQYMQESRMMAEIGSIEKVSGRSSDTPFGAPRPGSTPTRMPSVTPSSMSRMWLKLRIWPKPSMRRPIFSMSFLRRQAPTGSVDPEERLDRALQERNLEADLENDEEEEGNADARRKAGPPLVLALEDHRAGDIERRADVKAEDGGDRGEGDERQQEAEHHLEARHVDEDLARAAVLDEGIDEVRRAAEGDQQ